MTERWRVAPVVDGRAVWDDVAARVRDLHQRHPDIDWCVGCWHTWPCPTIRALDGEP